MVKFKRGARGRKADISFESIIKLILVSMALLLALYVGFAFYNVLTGKPDEGTIKTLNNFVEEVNKLKENDPSAKAFYVGDKSSMIVFNKGVTEVHHFADDRCIDNRDAWSILNCKITRPTNAPPRGCEDIDKVCVCICGNGLFGAHDHCEEVKDCRYLLGAERVVVAKSIGSTDNIKGNWGTKNQENDGRDFVLFGDRLTANAFRTKSWYLTQHEGVIYITEEEPKGLEPSGDLDAAGDASGEAASGSASGSTGDLSAADSAAVDEIMDPAAVLPASPPRAIPASEITENECKLKEKYFPTYRADGTFRFCIICLPKCLDYKSDYSCNDVQDNKCSLACKWENNGCVDST